MIGPIVAQTVCTLQQCNFCKDIDPDSWAWIFSGCWLIGTEAFAAGVSLTAALLISRAYLWALGQEHAA